MALPAYSKPGMSPFNVATSVSAGTENGLEFVVVVVVAEDDAASVLRCA
jgi:hypothetical protein